MHVKVTLSQEIFYTKLRLATGVFAFRICANFWFTLHSPTRQTMPSSHALASSIHVLE